MKRIGIIADTHGSVDPAALDIFKGVDMILHAGDVGSAEVLEALSRAAPVIAVSGNHEDEVTSRLEWIKSIIVEDVKLALTHRFFPLSMSDFVNMPDNWQKMMGIDGVAAMIFGHSHEPLNANGGEVLYYNPGYSGPDMSEPLRTVGLMEISGAAIIRAETYFLSPPPRTEYLERALIFNKINKAASI